MTRLFSETAIAYRSFTFLILSTLKLESESISAGECSPFCSSAYGCGSPANRSRLRVCTVLQPCLRGALSPLRGGETVAASAALSEDDVFEKERKSARDGTERPAVCVCRMHVARIVLAVMG